MSVPFVKLAGRQGCIWVGRSTKDGPSDCSLCNQITKMIAVTAMGMLAGVPRWEGDARARLEAGALRLFDEKGYEHTTVGQIAAAAGMSERSFFNHFADKREVVFTSSLALDVVVLEGMDAQRGDVRGLDLVLAGFRHADRVLFDGRRDEAVRRARIIETSNDLRERGMIKRARLAEHIAGALSQRGVGVRQAELVAWTGVTAFYTAFARWTACDGTKVSLGEHLANTAAELRQVLTPNVG